MDASPTPTLVILAAGMGSRYGGLKQIEPVGPSGELIIEYSIFDALRAGFGKVVCVIREDLQADFERLLAPACRSAGAAIQYTHQRLDDIPGCYSAPPARQKQWGTAHAVYSCRHIVREPFAVLNADDFYGRGSFDLLCRFLLPLQRDEPRFGLVAFKLRNTLSEYGAVSRGICDVSAGGLLKSVVERHGIERDGDGGRFSLGGEQVTVPGETLVSMNMWGFTPAFFGALDGQLRHFLSENGSSEKAECYIPSVVDALIAAGQATVRCLPSEARWFGVTHPLDKESVAMSIRKLVEQGEYPKSLWRQ